MLFNYDKSLKNQIYNNFKEHDAFDFLIDLLKMLHVELNFNKIKSQDFNNSTTEVLLN